MNRISKENYYLDIAQTVLERATCLRRVYGAIIVNNDEIISTGYNGAPRGRKNCVDMQNEWAGAQAFSSFDTYLAPFVRVDSLSQREVKQCIQSFVYGVNTPSRWGTQAPFSNITLDWTVPRDLADLPAIVGGKKMDFTYGDCKKEMDMTPHLLQECLINITRQNHFSFFTRSAQKFCESADTRQTLFFVIITSFLKKASHSLSLI